VLCSELCVLVVILVSSQQCVISIIWCFLRYGFVCRHCTVFCAVCACYLTVLSWVYL